MLTFGPLTLLVSESALSRRAPGRGAAIGSYVRAWDEPLKSVYDQLPTIEGERSLIVSLAPGDRHEVWVVAADARVDPMEVALVVQAKAHVAPVSGILQPIMLGISFWTGPTAVPPHALGRTSSRILPEELARLGQVIAEGASISTERVLDAYWDAHV